MNAIRGVLIRAFFVTSQLLCPCLLAPSLVVLLLFFLLMPCQYPANEVIGQQAFSWRLEMPQN